MAEQEQEQDRSEQATPFKLREAKRRGQVAKSMETNSAVILCGVLLLVLVTAESIIEGQLAISRTLFSQADDMNLNAKTTVGLVADTGAALLKNYWRWAALIMAIAVLANLLQTGPVFSFHPLKPDFKRINPVSGFKRLFSVRLLFESIKTFVKLALIIGVLFFSIQAMLPELMGLLDMQVPSYAPFLISEIVALVFKLFLVLLIIAAIDLAYTKWDFAKKMRMSRREVKEEVKRREGDPHVRARQKEIQKDASKRAGALQHVPDADVVITNPTHYAVALLYEKDRMAAPQIVAKGAGELAQKIKSVAKKHQVPVVENKPLAQSMFKQGEINQVIPVDCYKLVARILVWVYAMKQKQNSGEL